MLPRFYYLPFLAWCLIVGATSVGLCFIPLFNLLAFEFAFAISIPLTLVGGHIGVLMKRDTRNWYERAITTMATTFALTFCALLPILLNTTRVQNCNLVEGLLLFAIFPLTGLLIALFWGKAAETIFPNRGFVAFTWGWFGCIVYGAFKFYFSSPVDIFSPFLGYWPGALYDDVFLLDNRIVWSRIEDFVLALTAFMTAHRRATSANRGRIHRPTALIVGICCISVHLQARQVGVYRSDEYIQSELGGAIVSKHFQVFFPVHWPNQKVKTLVADLEFYHAELAQFFGRAPEVPIRVFYYKNRHQKKRLMGARKTRIAKPWQWAFHIDNPRIALSTVKHEMAHIFAAQYGKAPHRLSLSQTFLPNMGIIEGVAEAATWPHRRLNLHESSAAMKQLGFAPDIRFVFAPEKFYGVNGSTAYTLCGSFLRFLYDKHGAQMLWQVYRQGHLEGIDGLNLDALMTDWEGHLNGITLPESALAEARLRYDRPSIFGRACAREIASLWRTYRHALQSNRASHAEATLGEILGHLPSNPNARLAEIDLMIRNGRLKDALPRARQLSRDQTAGGVIRSYASERYLDALVMTGGDADVDITYDSLAAETFQRPRLRNLGIKSAALKRPGVKAEIVRYLSGRLDRAQRLEALNSIERESGSWPELDYLKARVLLNGSENQLSLALFERAYRGLSAPALRYETLRLLARQLFDKRCYRKSAIAYQRLSNRVDLEILPSEKANHQEWSRRSTFFAAIQDQVQDLCPIKIDISIFGDEDAPNH